jgi:hypothetical protein
VKQIPLLSMKAPTWRERLADHLRDFGIRQRARQDRRDKRKQPKAVVPQAEQRGLFE